MGNRCGSCNKFVSLEEPELEGYESADVNGDEVEFEANLVRNCGTCGEEMKRLEMSFGVEIEHDCRRDDDKIALEFETVGDPIFEVISRCKTETVRIGKRGKNKGKKIVRHIPARYQVQEFGVSVSQEVKCELCKERVMVEDEVYGRASAFEDSQ